PRDRHAAAGQPARRGPGGGDVRPPRRVRGQRGPLRLLRAARGAARRPHRAGVRRGVRGQREGVPAGREGGGAAPAGERRQHGVHGVERRLLPGRRRPDLHGQQARRRRAHPRAGVRAGPHRARERRGAGRHDHRAQRPAQPAGVLRAAGDGRGAGGDDPPAQPARPRPAARGPRRGLRAPRLGPGAGDHRRGDPERRRHRRARHGRPGALTAGAWRHGGCRALRGRPAASDGASRASRPAAVAHRGGRQMGLPYTRGEVKDRARAHWRGACNVTLPSFTQDFTALNEAGIRHDVRRSAEFGFWGTLIASECGTTFDQYLKFMEIAADAAPAGLKLVTHASFSTTDEALRACQCAEELGYEAVLLSYPPSFQPKSPREIVEYTRAFAEKTNLAIILFGVLTWGFKRLHPSGFPPEALEEMAKLPTAAAIKYEANPPAMPTGLADTLRRCGQHVLVECPLEQRS